MELIIVQPDYLRHESNYIILDIAVIVLKSDDTRILSPVCIDWSNNYTVSNGSNGKVSGL